MISRETLAALVPEGRPELTLDALHPREAEAVAEDGMLQAIALWCEALRRAMLPYLSGAEGGLIGSYLDTHPIVGFGIVDLPQVRPERLSFPSRDGLALGVALHGPHRAVWERTMIEVEGRAFPVIPTATEFALQADPPNGRSAAVVSDGVDDFLLTARHVVERQSIGARTNLSCSNCPGGCWGTVAYKGHLYLDVALVRIGHARCPGAVSGAPPPLAAARGATVRHHFASTTGAVRATVMQGIGPRGSFVNAAAPLTFLTDAVGQGGDSGSAVSDDAAPGHERLIGLYNGYTDSRVSSGAIVTHGFGHDAAEALDLFACTLKQGLYR